MQNTPAKQETQSQVDSSGSSGLIFVSAHQQPSEGPDELNLVLNSFFGAAQICASPKTEANSVESDAPKQGQTPIAIKQVAVEAQGEQQEAIEEPRVVASDPYARTQSLTFMQKKLLRLQQDHLDAFKGGSLADIAVPKLSKLEQERKALESQRQKSCFGQKPTLVQNNVTHEETFASAKPRKSRLEREKEEAAALAQ